LAVQEAVGDFDRLLSYLKKTRGFDFTAYKRSTLTRRVQKRMSMVGCEDFDSYVDYLQVHPDEFLRLFNTILINVTSFFRDPEAWDYVAKEIIPRAIHKKNPRSSVRCWVAGCASGEEAYTLAMLLVEALGIEEFRERVKIYATDLDEDALARSRMAAYTSKELESVPAQLVEKYFEAVQDRYIFDREIRRSIIFGKHDLIADAPISRVDLLLCRNTLMYFNAEAQERILTRFHFALSDEGFLFLGKAETLLAHPALFSPKDMKNRVFTKVASGKPKDRTHLMGNGQASGESTHDVPTQLQKAAFEASPVAQIVIEKEGRLLLVSEKARTLFGISARDVGKVIQDLEVSFRPVELRSGIEKCYETRRTFVYKDVRWLSPSSDTYSLEIKIVPLLGAEGELIGCCVCFEDETEFKRLHEDLENFNQELETAYEEVQSTNEELQTTNEELQSTIEELETTNEELQSTNEELETMNEELQSTNEELETINEEFTKRSHDLNEANAFLHSILEGLTDGVIVVDSEFGVLAWNAKSEDMWGLRAAEVEGKHLLNLDIGLPLEKLRSSFRTCIASGKAGEVQLEAINRRGRSIKIRTIISPLISAAGEPRGAIILIEEVGAALVAPS
jgi:two-component system, chemotaxis family, CheB/CheR fusion protein